MCPKILLERKLSLKRNIFASIIVLFFTFVENYCNKSALTFDTA